MERTRRHRWKRARKKEEAWDEKDAISRQHTEAELGHSRRKVGVLTERPGGRTEILSHKETHAHRLSCKHIPGRARGEKTNKNYKPC